LAQKKTHIPGGRRRVMVGGKFVPKEKNRKKLAKRIV